MVQGGGSIIPPKNNNMKKDLAAVSCSLAIDNFTKHRNFKLCFPDGVFQGPLVQCQIYLGLSKEVNLQESSLLSSCLFHVADPNLAVRYKQQS